MAIQGLRDTGNFVTGQRPENWREGILMLYPKSAEAAKAPLTALTSRMKSASTNDPWFHWWEKSLQTRRVALNANLLAASAGAVQVITVVRDALAFKEGDLLMVENGLLTGANCEVVQVAQDPTSDTSLTVTRGVAGSTPGTLTYNGAGVNPNLVCIGSAYEEGSLAPTGVQFDPVDVYNYTQIFRATTEMTRSAAKTKLRTGDQKKEAKRECLENIGIDMERAFFFGRRATSVKNGKPLRFANGIYHQLAAGNRLTPTTAGQLSMADLDEWMLKFFAAGSSQKVAFGGNRAFNGISQAVRKNTNYQIFVNEKEYGMKITRIVSPYGELVLFSHALFTQMVGGTTSGTAYAGLEASMFVLDMENIRYRYLDGSDLSYEDGLEIPGMDGTKEGYIAECALELNHASTHFFCYNMGAGKVDP